MEPNIQKFRFMFSSLLSFQIIFFGLQLFYIQPLDPKPSLRLRLLELLDHTPKLDLDWLRDDVLGSLLGYSEHLKQTGKSQ